MQNNYVKEQKMKRKENINHMPMPSWPGTMFIMIQANLSLSILKALLDRPSPSRSLTHIKKRYVSRSVGKALRHIKMEMKNLTCRRNLALPKKVIVISLPQRGRLDGLLAVSKTAFYSVIRICLRLVPFEAFLGELYTPAPFPVQSPQLIPRSLLPRNSHH